MSDSLLTEIGKWANHYPNEVLFCLTEHDYMLPTIGTATRSSANPVEDCPPRTVAIWHTHPMQNATVDRFKRLFFDETGRMPESARDMCYLSESDVKHTRDAVPRPRPDLAGNPVHQRTPWAVVQVTPQVYCWWSPEQVEAIDPVNAFNWPPDGQTSWADG